MSASRVSETYPCHVGDKADAPGIEATIPPDGDEMLMLASQLAPTFGPQRSQPQTWRVKLKGKVTCSGTN